MRNQAATKQRSKTTIFNLTKTTEIVYEKKTEKVYHYTEAAVSGGREVVFHSHPTRAFVFIPMKITGNDKTLFNKIINAWVNRGMDQNEFAGGFDEAIATLEIK